MTATLAELDRLHAGGNRIWFMASAWCAYPALRARIAEMEEAAAGDAKVAAEAVQRIAELERKGRCFDAIAQAWLENRFSLTIGADNEDGFVDIDSLEPTDTPETLLTAIDAALAAKGGTDA